MLKYGAGLFGENASTCSQSVYTKRGTLQQTKSKKRVRPFSLSDEVLSAVGGCGARIDGGGLIKGGSEG